MAPQPAAPAQANALPPLIYASFADNINQASFQRIFNNFAIAINGGVTHVHLLFQSTGGCVGDGIALYNFLRSAPIEITLYNAGAVQSIATIAFLGARHRKASQSAVFQIHKTTGPPIAATVDQLADITEAVALDDARTDEILRRHTNLSDQQWAMLRNRNLWFGAVEAVERGFADGIGEFSPPQGARVFNV